MSASRSLLLVCLLAVNILANSSEEGEAKDLEFDKCDLLLDCYMHNRCPLNVDDECWERFNSLLRDSSGSLAEKRSGKVKLKTILLGSYLHRMG